MGRDRTERHQRGRLEGAMAAAVAEHGYVETTVAELVGLAGVSKSTFYEHFDGKEDCFLSTFDTIVDEVGARVGAAYRSQSGLEERLTAAFTRFAETVGGESAAASLVVVDSLFLGARAVPYRERAAESFELMIRQSFQSDPGDAEPSDLEVRAIVAGIWTVVYRCLRAGSPQEVADQLHPLMDWALSYRRAGKPRPVASRSVSPKPTDEGPPAIGLDEPPDSARSRSELTQRERIVRAAAQVAADGGYASLTIPAISAAAGTSNQTFYEHFQGKEEAFIVAFEELAERALRSTFSAAASESHWPATVEAGTRGLLEHIAAEPVFARLAFFELPTAGAVALDKADAAIRRFTGFLQPEALPDRIAPLPPVLIEAIGGGMWAAIQHEIVEGHLGDLPQMAPAICDIALVPLRLR